MFKLFGNASQLCMKGIRGCCGANGIERNDWRGGIHSDVIDVFHCDLLFLIACGTIFPGHYFVIWKYHIYLSLYELCSFDNFRIQTSSPYLFLRPLTR